MDLSTEFAAELAYLNTATYGLAPRAATDAALAHERDRVAGRLSMPYLDECVERSRTALISVNETPPVPVMVSPSQAPSAERWPARTTRGSSA